MTYIDDNGYERFRDSGIPVHCWAAERKLGRKLRPLGVVHHKDRDKQNNAFELRRSVNRQKKEQVLAFKIYALKHHCWIANTDTIGEYLAKGGESTVYLLPDNTRVVKLNDGDYYVSWLDYLNSMVLHNLFFPETD